MGTSNFARLNNATKYFTVLMNVEEKYVKCNECNEKFYEYEPEYETAESEHYCGKCGSDAIEFKEDERSIEDWEVEDFKSYFKEQLEKIGGTYDDEELVHDRNRPARYLGYFQQSKFYGEEEFTVRLRIYYQHGYYEGANLDYDIEIEGRYGWEEVNEELWNGSKITIEDIIISSLEGSDLPKGMQKIQSKNIIKWIDSYIKETSSKIEGLFSETCENKLDLIGVFSNGEAIYEQSK